MTFSLILITRSINCKNSENADQDKCGMHTKRKSASDIKVKKMSRAKRSSKDLQLLAFFLDLGPNISGRKKQKDNDDSRV